ncbi:MAG: hypothetical protein WBX15_17460 [Thermoanaerobaculia bacterium]
MQFGATDVLVLTITLGTAGVLAFLPSLRRSRAWTATTTPLASIMGSGFLVSAPLLVGAAGLYAPLAMAALLVVAYAVGSVIRFNIRYTEVVVGERPREAGEHTATHGHALATEGLWARRDRSLATDIERASHVILAGAYLVSVTYYLSLLSAFVLDAFRWQSPFASKTFTTALLVVITSVGLWRGLRALEGVERYAVALNLGMIAALLAALAIFHVHALSAGTWHLPAIQPSESPLRSLRDLMGLLIVVQGFETSRFLGATHSPEQRVRTMRIAQLISAGIYLLFTTLALLLFHPGAPPRASVTEIVHLVGPVAAILPLLIVIAAGVSQFSAAVADDAGCSGLLKTIFRGRVSSRIPYVLIGAGTVALAWSTDVLQILSYASRAFAVFYAFQCLVAVLVAVERRDAEGRVRIIVVGSLAAIATSAVAVFGIPAAG